MKDLEQSMIHVYCKWCIDDGWTLINNSLSLSINAHDHAKAVINRHEPHSHDHRIYTYTITPAFFHSPPINPYAQSLLDRADKGELEETKYIKYLRNGTLRSRDWIIRNKP